MAKIKLQSSGKIVMKDGRISCECCGECGITNGVTIINFVITGTNLPLLAGYSGTLNGSWSAPRETDELDPTIIYCRASIDESESPFYPPEILTGPLIYNNTQTGDPPVPITYTDSVAVIIAQFPAIGSPFDNQIWLRIRLRTYRTTLSTLPNVFLHQAAGKLEKGKIYANQLANGGNIILDWS